MRPTILVRANNGTNASCGNDGGGEEVRRNVFVCVLICGFMSGKNVGMDSYSERIEACVVESIARRMHLKAIIRI